MVTFYPDVSCWACVMAHAALISPMWLNACGKFPDHLAAGRVDLLGQQADIVDGGHGTLERRSGGLDLSGQQSAPARPGGELEFEWRQGVIADELIAMEAGIRDARPARAW